MSSLHSNSLAANAAGRVAAFGARSLAILDVFKERGRAMSDREVMAAFGFTDPNKVRPRITELVEAGALAEVGARIDPETRKRVRLVAVRSAVAIPLQAEARVRINFRMTTTEIEARADFAAGRKNELSYATSDLYRRFWQTARREAVDDFNAPPGVVAAAIEELHAKVVPFEGVSSFASSNEVEKTDIPAETKARLDLIRTARDMEAAGILPSRPSECKSFRESDEPANELSNNVLRRELPVDSKKPPYRVPSMAEIAALPRNGFKVVSTFSGCGGSSLGYKMAGFSVLWANEFIPAAQETYRANHPGTILDVRDIRTVLPEEILAATGLAVGELDLFDGSPPCASFSTAGIREEGWGRVKKYSDTKQRTDDLFFEYARLLKGLQPKTFVAENVAGLTVGVAKEMLGDGQLDAFETQEDTILHTLMDCGYRVGFHVLNAVELGVPQSRRRVIFVGVRKDLAATGLEPAWPRPLGYRLTIRDALAAPIPAEHDVAGVDITRYAIGAEWDKLKPGEQSEKYFSLIRTHPDEPCPCICASHGAGGIASIAHFAEKRKFSIGELRRLGGFPDDFLLTGTYEQQWERIGRAVPPVMMAAVAATIRDEILAKIAPVPIPKGLEPAPLPEPAAAPAPIGQLELFL